MNANVSDVQSQFSKKELLAIAEELEIAVVMETRSVEIIGLIFNDLDENGVPDVSDPESEASDLLAEFLLAAELIDENGNVIEEDKSEESKKEEPKEVEESVQLPECYGFQDDLDPACGKCSFVEQCKAQRIKNRPQCFGKLYKAHDPECQVCLETRSCKQQVIS